MALSNQLIARSISSGPLTKSGAAERTAQLLSVREMFKERPKHHDQPKKSGVIDGYIPKVSKVFTCSSPSHRQLMPIDLFDNFS